MENEMQSISLRRRRFLARAAAILGASGVTVKTLAGSCVDPNGSDSSLRQSLHYVISSSDPSKQCHACGFFSEPTGACGKCMIFSGPADANGHCDSWAARG